MELADAKGNLYSSKNYPDSKKMTSLSFWDRLNFHTIRLTGHPMSNLVSAQTYLYHQLETTSTLDLPRGTIIWTRSDQSYREGPASFDLNPSSGHSQTSAEIITDLSLPSVDLESLLESMTLFFNQSYSYQTFTLNDLALLMKVSGFSGYQNHGQLMIFDLSMVKVSPQEECPPEEDSIDGFTE